MINGSERTYFQTDLLNFDTFLIIFHFVRDSPWSYSWFHPSPDRLGLGFDARSCRTTSSAQWTSNNFIFPLKFGMLVSLYLCKKHTRFRWDIFKTGPMIKILDFENCRWPRPRKHWWRNVQFTSTVHSIYRYQMIARMIKKHNTVINWTVFYGKWAYLWLKKGLSLASNLKSFLMPSS